MSEGLIMTSQSDSGHFGPFSLCSNTFGVTVTKVPSRWDFGHRHVTPPIATRYRCLEKLSDYYRSDRLKESRVLLSMTLRQSWKNQIYDIACKGYKQWARVWRWLAKLIRVNLGRSHWTRRQSGEMVMNSETKESDSGQFGPFPLNEATRRGDGNEFWDKGKWFGSVWGL